MNKTLDGNFGKKKVYKYKYKPGNADFTGNCKKRTYTENEARTVAFVMREARTNKQFDYMVDSGDHSYSLHDRCPQYHLSGYDENGCINNDKFIPAACLDDLVDKHGELRVKDFVAKVKAAQKKKEDEENGIEETEDEEEKESIYTETEIEDMRRLLIRAAFHFRRWFAAIEHWCRLGGISHAWSVQPTGQIDFPLKRMYEKCQSVDQHTARRIAYELHSTFNESMGFRNERYVTQRKCTTCGSTTSRRLCLVCVRRAHPEYRRERTSRERSRHGRERTREREHAPRHKRYH